MSVKIVEEIPCSGGNSGISLFALHADVSEDKLHLVLVVLSGVLPQLDDDWLEVVVDVVSLTNYSYDVRG